MHNTPQVQNPVLSIFAPESVQHRNRTLAKLYTIAHTIQNSDDIKGRIGRYFSLHPKRTPSYRLCIKRHDKDEANTELFPGDYAIVGRSCRSNLYVDDPEVSGLHCVFSSDNRGRLTIMDLASLNGTFVNRLRIQSLKSFPIEPGFEIGTGKTHYCISRVWDHSYDAYETGLIVNISVRNEEKRRVRYRRWRVSDRRNNCSFEVYVCLEMFTETIMEYFGLSAGRNESLFCTDQLVLEMEDLFAASIIKRFNSEFSEWFKLDDLSCVKNVPGNLIRCDLTIGADGKSSVIVLLIDPNGFSGFSSLNQSCRQLVSYTGLSAKISRLQVHYVCFCRHIVLMQSQFENVRIGDVLFPGLGVSKTFGENGSEERVYLAVEGSNETVSIVTCDCRIDIESVVLKIHSTYRGKDCVMKQMSKVESHPEWVTAICETRFLDISNEPLVEVRIEIGRLKLSIAELSEWHSGTLVRIKRAINEPVSVWIDDCVVGTGRLVQIHEEYGVELMTWEEER